MFFSSFFGGTRFTRELKCFPLSFVGREDLEIGNRLILPPSALEELTRLQVPTPMLFEISDLDQRYRTHGGVLEFIAPEETCYMPFWILKKLLADEGDVLRISLKSSLPRATFVKFRPAQVALLRVYNPRALLENGLRNFVALTVGDSFSVDYNGQKYAIEVVELRPGEAVSIIETDVQVEFATPLDAARGTAGTNSSSASTSASGSQSAPKQSEEVTATSQQAAQPSSMALFSGPGQRPDGLPVLPLGDSDADDDPRPWKRRIPRGVKWTNPPAGYDPAMFGQSAADRAAVAQSAPADFSGKGHVGGKAVAPELVKVNALQAAEKREAAQADDIARRRAEEEEARRRAAEDEEKARRHALDLAARERNRPRAAESAPTQKQMTNGGAGRRPGDSGGSPDGSNSLCCGCLRSGTSSPDNKV